MGSSSGSSGNPSLFTGGGPTSLPPRVGSAYGPPPSYPNFLPDSGMAGGLTPAMIQAINSSGAAQGMPVSAQIAQQQPAVANQGGGGSSGLGDMFARAFLTSQAGGRGLRGERDQLAELLGAYRTGAVR